MNSLRSSSATVTDPGLAVFAKAVVGCTLILILLGGLVTSWQAGMAVPDWPLSYGSLNPSGWWGNFPIRLEHGHRLFAMLVAISTAVLCSWVWENWRSLLLAVCTSVIVPGIAHALHAPPMVMMHLGVWPAAIVFVTTILVMSGGSSLPARSAAVRWMALIAFFCVCVQATLGGLRVTQETAGALNVALVLRIVHGCFAQAFLCLLVAIATHLSQRWRESWQYHGTGVVSIRRLAWVTVGAVYVQLIAGAAMRHMGAGLAIPTFPSASADGRFMPPVHNRFVDINFTHTRFGAFLVTALVASLATLIATRARKEPRLVLPALSLFGLLCLQVGLGIFVIWHTKPPTLTTLHVVNGAILLATSLLIALRASHFETEYPFAQKNERLAELPV